MPDIREILVAWRKGDGERRNLIGRLKRTANEGITFRYLEQGCKQAVKDGFSGFLL